MKRLGGQALIDGIIMIGRKCSAIVRRKLSGRIDIETREKRIVEPSGIEKIFIIRGMINFINTIRDSVKNLNLWEISSENGKSNISNSFIKVITRNRVLMFVLSSIFLMFIFFILPEFIVFIIPSIKNIQLISFIKFIIRLILIFAYIMGISSSSELSKILRYHGAEHKVINCYESKGELTVENVKKSSRFHKRCGTNFIIYILICYLMLFFIIPRYNFLINILIELIIFPIVIGISYEILDYMERSESIFSSMLFSISKLIQQFTTKEPKDDEIEVAIIALKISEGIKVKNTIKELFLMGRSILRDANIESYSLDSRLIIEYCLRITPTQVFTSEVEVSKEDEKKYLDLIEQRKNGKPIAYMVGKKEFYGIDFIVKEGVLIPRTDSEILVDKVLEILNNNENCLSICDLCSGSGAIGISIQKNNKNVNCTYVDNYEIPLKVTEENIYIHDLKDRSYVVKSDLLEFFIKNGLELDGIVSNPPYIKSKDIKNLMKDVKDYEPHEALDGGDDGLSHYRKICEQAKEVLVDNGFIAFEIPYNKAFDIMYIMTNNNFVNIDIYKDINEHDRVIIGYYKSKIE